MWLFLVITDTSNDKIEESEDKPISDFEREKFIVFLYFFP